jgi:hypothetical protein
MCGCAVYGVGVRKWERSIQYHSSSVLLLLLLLRSVAMTRALVCVCV